MNLGLHVIQFPSGRFGYVGKLPVELAQEVPATKSDVTGGRAHWGPDNKTLLAYKWPTFSTNADAREFAAARGFPIASK